MTTSGYPRIAKVWRRGTPLAAAETIYEGKAEDVRALAFRDHTKGFERDFVHRQVTTYTNELFLRRDGTLLKVEKPDSADAFVHRDLLLLQLRDDWAVGGVTYPAGALLAGASWMEEYGNPDDPKEWEFIRTFSPYHNVKAGVKYPPTLIMTSTRDDRVHPGHARKMMALLSDAKQDVLYYENIEGGHSGAANNKEAAHMSALAYTFLWQRLR
jgi:prolyl oligopeptidase PreP (S9A serine peptidase family)